VKGLEGKTVIDATNLYGDLPPDGFPSNAEFVKSKANGPTAKAFNLNFAALYPRLGEARARPSDLWCGDAEAREVVEQLNRDAGYDPVYMGPIEPRLRPGSDERGHRRQSAEKWARTSFGSHRLSCCDLSCGGCLGSRLEGESPRSLRITRVRADHLTKQVSRELVHLLLGRKGSR
jgi:hypothetical protein